MQDESISAASRRKQLIYKLFTAQNSESSPSHSINSLNVNYLDESLTDVKSQIDYEQEQKKIEQAREKESLNHDEKTHEIKRASQQQKLDNEAQNIELRRKFANDNFQLVKCYLMVVALLILETGAAHLGNLTFLSDNILITLLTTTTVNVIGIYLIVLHYLFKLKSHKNESNKKQKK